MCGIFGWVADYHDTEPDPRLMQLAADGAANRGPHAHGWAIPGQPTHRALGPLDPAHLPSGARVLGHARLATYGQSTDLAAVQPIEVDGHHLVHNGNAAAAYGEYPHAPSDTAALAIIYAAHRTSGHPPAAALTYTAARIDSAWALAVLDSDGSLWVSPHESSQGPVLGVSRRTLVDAGSGRVRRIVAGYVETGNHLMEQRRTAGGVRV